MNAKQLAERYPFSLHLATEGERVCKHVCPNTDSIPIHHPLRDALACSDACAVRSMHYSVFRAYERRPPLQLRREHYYYLLDWEFRGGRTPTMSDVEWWLSHRRIGSTPTGQFETATPQELVALSNWYIFGDFRHQRMIANWLPILALGGDFRTFGSMPREPSDPGSWAKLSRCYFVLRQLNNDQAWSGTKMIEIQLAASCDDSISYPQACILVRSRSRVCLP